MEEIIAREDNLIEQEQPTIVEPIKTRDNRIDIIKAIAIILMVIGHALLGNTILVLCYAFSWIYLFHMAVFFIASGFCFKEDAVKDGKSYLRFIWKKVKSLYIPYVLFNVACLLLNNVFVLLNLYGQEMYMQSFPIKQILKVFLLSGGATIFGGATWFLKTIFFVSITHGTLTFLIRKVTNKNFIYYLVGFVCLVVSVLFQLGVIKVPSIFSQFFSAYANFVIGIIIKKYVDRLNFKLKVNIILAIVAAISLVGLAILNEIVSVGVMIFAKHFISPILGWIMLWCLADIINKGKSWLLKSLCYIGKNTMFIVLWHFVFFKPVSLIYIWISKLPIVRLAESPVLILSNWWLWIVYTIVSIALCLLLREVYCFVKTKIINAINKKKVKV